MLWHINCNNSVICKLFYAAMVRQRAQMKLILLYGSTKYKTDFGRM